MPDVFGDQFAPFAALMAADATTMLRVGNLVLDNDCRHPVVLAKEAAALDLLSDNRFELGLRAGWLQTEYEQAGIPFDAAGVRIDRMVEAIRVIEGLVAVGPVVHAGARYASATLEGYPKPIQRPHPPVLIGGAGKRTPGIAGREADIVHFLPRTIATGTLVSDPRDRLTCTVAAKVGWLREAAGDRFDRIEPGLGATFVVADDRRAATERLLQGMGWDGVAPDEVWDVPSVFVGTVDGIADEARERRERLWFAYVVVQDDAMDACGPIVARLAGG